MQRMSRQMFAAVVGVLAVAGLASAQSGAPNPFPPLKGVPAPTAPAGQVTPAAGVVPVRGTGGCTNCGPNSSTHANYYGGYYTTAVPNARYSQANSYGCGSAKADCTFLFGSCKSFFSPCGPYGVGLSGGCGSGGCGVHPYGKPYGTGYNGCKYDSYLNH